MKRLSLNQSKELSREIIETSITTNYREKAWGLERIVLDGASNHLPEDSKGTKMQVILKQDGEYVPLKKANPNKKTEQVIFADDGVGYDSEMLSILFSSKNVESASVGQFGEGLKMIAAASKRKGVDIRYQSQDWEATPFIKEIKIGENQVGKLCFNIEKKEQAIKGSRTIIDNPSEEMMKEVFQIPSNILALNDSYKVLSKGGSLGQGYYPSRIIKLPDDQKTLFIKGVKVKKGINSIFSYDLGLSNITPDRIFADQDSVLNNINSLLRWNSSPEIRETILKEAEESPEENYLEFQSFSLSQDRRGILDFEEDYFPHDSFSNYKGLSGLISVYTEQEKRSLRENLAKNDPWAISFKKLFGSEAVLSSKVDTNNDTDAELMGYKPIELNYNIAAYLRKKGIKSADEICKNTKYHWVNSSDLTESEQKIINQIHQMYDLILRKNEKLEVKVYSGLHSESGREITSSEGVYLPSGVNREGPCVGIKREVLQDPYNAIKIALHEAGHYCTGASDYSREFTDFFIDGMAKFLINDSKIKNPD